jgi:prevent-host-death family protein
MTSVTVEEAQTKLAQLIEQAAGGEEVIISNEGVTSMRLTPVSLGFPKRRIGLLQGIYAVPDDIDTPFERDIEEMFYGDAEGE